MKIKLCKIKKECFDDLKNSIISDFESTGTLSFPADLIESNSEPILISGQEVEVEINLDKYLSIVKENTFYYTRQAKVGMELHKDLITTATVQLPRNLLREKEFWAFMSLTIFKDVVSGLRASLDSGKITASKIAQFYFNIGEPSRTGLLFIWVMVDQLNSANDFEITHTAFEFIDPVKAILERTMSNNPMILRAFVQGIINNKKSPKFKSQKFKSKVPSHISCYASVSILDALDYDDLVDVITREQQLIISGK